MQKTELKLQIANQLADAIAERYGYRHDKALSLATSASWWNKNLTTEQLEILSLDNLKADVFPEIDNKEIL